MFAEREARAAVWKEVLAFFRSRPGLGADVEKLFGELDTDSSGFVDASELIQGLQG